MDNNSKLYVGNLPYGMRDDDLQQHFGAFGQVQSAKVMMDRETGRSKGFGFVEMGSPSQAQSAIQGMAGQQFEIPRWSTTLIGHPGLHVGAGQPLVPVVVAPREAFPPIPLATHRGIEEPPHLRGGNARPEEEHVARDPSRRLERRRAQHFKMGDADETSQQQ